VGEDCARLHHRLDRPFRDRRPAVSRRGIDLAPQAHADRVDDRQIGVQLIAECMDDILNDLCGLASHVRRETMLADRNAFRTHDRRVDLRST
jgi:hypothetical protein